MGPHDKPILIIYWVLSLLLTSHFECLSYSKPSLQSSSSVPSNLSTYGLAGPAVLPAASIPSGQGTSLSSSPKSTAKKSLAKKKERKEEGLMEFLNSPIEQDASPQPPPSTPQPESVSYFYIPSTLKGGYLHDLFYFIYLGRFPQFGG